MSQLVRGLCGCTAGLRNNSGDDSYSCTVDLGILADVHAAVHSAAARFVMILCVQWCFATDSDPLLQLQPSLLDSGILAVDL